MKRRFYIVAVAIGAVCGCMCGAGAARAQAPPPAGAQTQTPPATTANLATGTETGIGTFQTHCMGCHGNPNVPQAPAPDAVRQMPPERIYDALTTGVMKPQGDSLTEDQRKMLATFLSGRPLGSLKEGDAKDMPNHCASNPPLRDPSSGPEWNGWSPDVVNSRFQTAKGAGLTADQVPQLKLKWAFGYPTGLSAFGQPTIVAGRVFVGSDIGYVYSLDAATGCIYWSYQAKGSVRSAVTVMRVKGRGATKYAAYFGDAHANVYAVDAQNGQQLWVTKVDEHFVARITAAPKVYKDRVYIPVSSSEEFSSSNLDYSCCTGRGSVVALDASTGAQVWKTYVVDTPKPVRKNSKGVQQYAPSGGSIWNSPTIDAKRGAIYVGTGDGQTEPAPDTTDAIMALDLKTGNVLWFYQAQAGDAFMGGCSDPATRTDNCPKVNGPDQDIGNSPILRKLANGKSVVVFGMKNGTVTALDPDRKGAVVWSIHAVEIPKGQENSFAAHLNGVRLGRGRGRSERLLWAAIGRDDCAEACDGRCGLACEVSETGRRSRDQFGRRNGDAWRRICGRVGREAARCFDRRRPNSLGIRHGAEIRHGQQGCGEGWSDCVDWTFDRERDAFHRLGLRRDGEQFGECAAGVCGAVSG